MDLLALLRKEAIATRRNLGLAIVLLVVLPGAIVAGTLVFEQTIPRDVPVGVVADDGASANDVAIVRAGIASFATPQEYETSDEATRALRREEIYLVIRVPGSLMDSEANATVTVRSDHAFVPFEEPVDESVGLVESELDRAFPATVSVEHERVGDPRTLSEFLVPTGVFVFVVLYALVYLPYQVRSERLVLDRLQTESRLDLVVASKLLFHGALLVIPAAIVAAVAAWAGIDVAALSPSTLFVLAVTFVYLAAIGLAVCFALRLTKTALFANLAVALGVFALSSLVYPVGFFSPVQGTISRALPTHYSAIAIRSTMLRDAPIALYADYLSWLAATAIGSLVALKLALAVYQRRR
ncbi:ABC transporter permease [Halosolutus gelatinilyticus]|uniref:ABC transporter permease n=1 Tax=Halosolutus gelatinilyticus TaxID=2931975 RepID=UPI001FF4E101|nr:ABC transporter permease [Halosolutus gelatinilyticus]